jgi:dienelactone hydrolase
MRWLASFVAAALSTAMFTHAQVAAPPAAQAPPPHTTAPPTDLREAVIRVPAGVVDAFGKTVRGDLVMTIFRPPGDGPFPLVVINHGRSTDTRAQLPRQRFESAARLFVRKGFAVAMPLRLGYGELASLGDPEDNMGCDHPRYQPAGEAAALQIVAVATHMQAQHDIDTTKLVLVGQSVGGFATVAANALRPAGLIAAINFAGGQGGNPQLRPGNPCQGQLITYVMAQWGAKAAAPMLWVYTENDQFFNPTRSKAWFDAYVAAGGKAEYRLLPPFGDDGHRLFALAPDRWQGLVVAFLAGFGFVADLK